MRILTDSRPADVFIQDTGLAFDVMITGPVGVRKTPDLAVREAMDKHRLPGTLRLYGTLPEAERQYHRRVWLHRLGADPATDVSPFCHGVVASQTELVDRRMELRRFGNTDLMVSPLCFGTLRHAAKSGIEPM